MSLELENHAYNEIVVEDDLELKLAQAQAQKDSGIRQSAGIRPVTSSAAMGAAIRDEFWLDDFRVLLRSDRLAEFIPNPNFDLKEQLNALTRFFLYLGVLVAFSRKSIKPFIFVAAIPISFIAYFFLSGMSSAADHIHPESFEQPLRKGPQRPAKRMHPTADNPFMNPDPTMYGTEAYFIPPADVNDPVVQKEITDAFTEGDDMFLDPEDVWDRKRGQLLFNTVPRQVDFGEFQDFLFQLPPETCKENASFCTPPYRTHDTTRRLNTATSDNSKGAAV